ncbi:MAG: SUMF1/EgtB/PvdO family nonheme iron enzyme [Polyangiaceae bacterium]|nr:SUMF1/EgtB/PvdO family nonheme iron enzyme [Polyangiaceae bacterium]
MVWIPGGAFVAGTPPDELPRKPHEEPPGEQIILQGFHIDVLAYPNEEGAIPLTNVSQARAGELCAAQRKRLCTELEWERACKGPDDLTYEYGDLHRAERCGTGAAAAPRPAGLRAGCKSDFGVRDLHGGAWEWTASPWGRGTTERWVAVRGGNGTPSEVVGRCANAAPRSPDAASPDVGFRCCAGAANPAEVTLRLERGRRLELDPSPDAELAARLVTAARAATPPLALAGEIEIDRSWTWRPVANESLALVAGCTRARDAECVMLLGRGRGPAPRYIGWVSTGGWLATVHPDADAIDLWVVGGDEQGQFKLLLRWTWGTVAVGRPERPLRPVPRPAASKPRGKAR